MGLGITNESRSGTSLGYRIASGAMVALVSAFVALPAMAEEKLPPSTFTLNVPVKVSRVTDDVKIIILYDVNTGRGYRASGEHEVPLKDGAFDGTITLTGKITYDARMADPMGRMGRRGGLAQGTPAPTPQPYPGRYSCSLQIRYANGHTYWPDKDATLDGYRAAAGAPLKFNVEGDYAW